MNPLLAKPPPRVAAHWYALHIHLSDPVLAGRFIGEWLQPRMQQMLQQGAIAGWFYLHYWEGGPHLRVRVRGLNDEGRAAWLATVCNEVPRWCAPAPPTRQAYYGAHGFDGQPADAAALPWFDEGTVRVVDYEPEYQRYGGAQALPLAERLFQQTSELAAALLRGSASSLHGRLGQALQLMPLYARALHGNQQAAMAAYFKAYADFWGAYSPGTRALAAVLQAQPGAATPAAAVQRQLQAPIHTLGAASSRLHEALRQAVEGLHGLHSRGELVCPFNGRVADSVALRDASVAAIFTSQMHMQNNRLGLAPGQELMLARQLANAAASLAAQGEQQDSRQTSGQAA